MTTTTNDGLDALLERHAGEEAAEAERRLVDAPRPLRELIPAGGALPTSKGWLDRLYAGERMPREKKPGVFDHLRSSGPWFVSVDEPPMSVVDGMSQTATVPDGFASDAVVRAYVEGDFADTILTARDTSFEGDPAAEAYAHTLRELLPGLPYVSFVNSGAESLEKAYALCLANRTSDAQKKLLCFEGSFHGRTLLSLHASYNPEKRAPYEIAGYEVLFAPYPLWNTPQAGEPGDPAGLHAALSEGLVPEAPAGDDLYAAELASLRAVQEALAKGDVFAVAIEPMQSEGGDRYATARFFRALRLLTRHHGVPLILDEVQTGFGLGGTFAWHTRFGLVDRDGAPDGPDCVTFAKRAQAGVVMSVFEDPAPTSAHGASLVRGRIHAELAASDPHACEVDGLVRGRLAALAARFPGLVLNPRNTGYAVAFDLPTADLLNRFLAQRFYRGVIVFGAGSRTVRYRLGLCYDAREVGLVFDAIEKTLAWLEAHPEAPPPGWIDPPAPAPAAREPLAGLRVREAKADEVEALLPGIVALEARVYEPARRDPEDKLRKAFSHPEGVAVVAEVPHGDGFLVIGSSLAVPLEEVADTEGPDRDPFLGRGNTLYSLATTVDPSFRGRGLGKALKAAQIRAAEARRREDGSLRFRHVSGRHRIGETDAMERVTRAFGGCVLFRMDHQYGEPDGRALYYRLPVGPLAPDAPTPPAEAVVHLADPGRPLAAPPASLRAALEAGALYGPTVNKLTLVNYVTPAIVRAVEHVAALSPAHPHLYLTSSRDEAFDKSLRVLRTHRPAARVALGLEGAYHGHTTAAARSLTDPAVHRAGPGYFDLFRRVPHPAEAGVEATITALGDAVAEAGGVEHVLGLFLEPVQERTGLVVPDDFWPALEALRDQLELPVVVSETATAFHRSGRGAFYTSGTDFVPDLLTWWAGGQVGFVHATKEMYVAKPLTLVSTWDGDELCLVRVDHQLRVTRELDVGALSAVLDRVLADAGDLARGAGAYRVLEMGDIGPAVASALSARGLVTRAFKNGAVAIAPPLDVDPTRLEAIAEVIREVTP